MELRQLRHFLAVFEHRHFGRAASECGLTQQALSHSISTLERALQARLFERGKFGAQATHIGRMFEKRARMICSEADFAAAEVMAFKGGVDGHIRLGISQNFSTHVMPQAILYFAKARPKIRLSVVVGTSKQLYDMAISRRIEMVVASPIGGVEAHPELEHKKLAGDYRHNPSYIVINPKHPLLEQPELSLSALALYPWCMPESWLTPWESIFELMRNAGATAPDYVLRTDSLTLVKSLLMESNFISLLGFEAVLTEIKAGLLTAVPLPLPTEPASAYVSYRKGHSLQAGIGPLIQCVERALSGVSGQLTDQPSHPAGPTIRACG